LDCELLLQTLLDPKLTLYARGGIIVPAALTAMIACPGMQHVLKTF
jgi:hypothetical protein